MHRELPNNDAWIARFKDFKAWVDAHGRLPVEDLDGGPEDTLHTWLTRQRAARANGTLASGLDAILDSVKGAFTELAPSVQERLDRVKELERAQGRPAPAKPTRNRVDRLESFYAKHGALPSFAGTEPDEQALYHYLNNTIRFRYRRGELDPLIVARLSRIPDVFSGRAYKRAQTAAKPSAKSQRAKERAARLEELITFCTENGRLPRTTEPAPEPALYDYLRRRLRPAHAQGLLDEVTTKRLLALPGVLVKTTRSTIRTSKSGSLAA